MCEKKDFLAIFAFSKFYLYNDKSRVNKKFKKKYHVLQEIRFYTDSSVSKLYSIAIKYKDI